MKKNPTFNGGAVNPGNKFNVAFGHRSPNQLVGPKNPCTLKGKWKAELYGPDGNLKDYREGFNVVTETGAAALASHLVDAVSGAIAFNFKYMAIGTDATAEASSNTALGTEDARHTSTVSLISNVIYQVVATFATGSGVGAIVEYGILNSNTGGTILTRDTESAINKGANDTLKVTAQLTVNAG